MENHRIILAKKQTHAPGMIAVLVPVIATFLAIINCSSFQQNNPVDTNGTNWHPPTISATNDMTVWVGDMVQLHATGTATNGSIRGYKWSVNNGTAVGTTEGEYDATFSTAGLQTVSVVAVDNNGVPSEPATIAITVLNKPALAVSTTSISLGLSSNSATFSITNTGGGTLQWSISSDAAWLTVSPTSGSTSAVASIVTVTAQTTNLAAGSYTGNITVTSGSVSKVVTVTMSVTPVLSVSTSLISLGSNNNSALFMITNTGNGTIQWTTSSDATWLTVSPTSGSTSTVASVVTVQGNTSTLSNGNYTGNITVTSGSVSKVITVTMSIITPVLAVSTNLISLSTSNSETFSISNTGGGTIQWTISSNSNWFAVSPTSGSTAAAASIITVTANANSSAAGDYSGTITIASGSTTKPVTVIKVVLPTTITVTNYLILPVFVYVNSVYAKSVPANTTLIDTVSSSLSNMTVSWALDRDLVGGVYQGEPMEGTFAAVQSPTGNHSYSITNVVGSTTYFAPVITNTTSSAITIGINWGLVGQVECGGVIPASDGLAYNVGYYILYTNSDVVAFLDGSNFTGTYETWQNFNSNVASLSGRVNLTLTVAP
jgi:Viral BACON domain